MEQPRCPKPCYPRDAELEASMRPDRPDRPISQIRSEAVCGQGGGDSQPRSGVRNRYAELQTVSAVPQPSSAMCVQRPSHTFAVLSIVAPPGAGDSQPRNGRMREKDAKDGIRLGPVDLKTSQEPRLTARVRGDPSLAPPNGSSKIGRHYAPRSASAASERLDAREKGAKDPVLHSTGPGDWTGGPVTLESFARVV